MAAETIKEFLVGLGFKVDQAGLSRFASGIASASAKAMALGAAITAAAGAVAMGIKKIAQEGEHEARLAERFRTTAAAVDSYLDSMSILGLSGEKAEESLRSLDRAIVDTSMGMGRAAKIFEELGIEAKDSTGKLRPTLEVMGELSEKMKGMDRGSQLRIMERLGLDYDLLYYFNTDLKKLGDEISAIDKGAGFSFDKWIAESKTFMVAWREMTRETEKWKMLFGKWIKGIAVELMPAFREQLGRMTAGMVDLRRKAMEVLPKVAQAFVPMLKILFRVAEAFIRIGMRVAEFVARFVGWLAKLNAATDGWIGWILAAAAAWKYLNLAFLATPLGALLALGVAIAALVDDFLTWKEGGESLIDWSGDLGDAMQALIDLVLFLGEAIIIGIGKARDWLADFFEWCAESWAQMKDDALETAAYIAGMWGAVHAAWAAAMQALGAILQGAWAAIAAGWQIVADAVQSAVQAACAAIVSAWQAVQAWLRGFFQWLQGAFPQAAAVVQKAAGIIGAAGQGLIAAWQSVRAWFSDFFGFITSGFAKLSDLAGKIGGIAGKLGGAVKGMFGGGISAPAPATQAALAGGAQTLNQKTTITVQGAGNPQATARAVAGAQNRVNADMARNMRGAVK